MAASEIAERLARDWAASGIAPGDTVLLHSSAKRTFRRIIKMGGKPDPELVVASFLDALGQGGTLLLPLFNFDFADGTPFDIRTSPSQMGAVTEAGRLWPGAVRTGHPIYSFAVIGARAGDFEGVLNFSGYGADSPFGMLHRMGGKIAVLDLPDQNSMTFYHYVEESLEVDYRYHKTFTGPYKGLDGKEAERTFGLFVRDVERGVLTRVDPMGERLWDLGLYRGSRPGEGAGLRVIEAAAMYDAVAAAIRGGEARELLYDIA